MCDNMIAIAYYKSVSYWTRCFKDNIYLFIYLFYALHYSHFFFNYCDKKVLMLSKPDIKYIG